MHSDKQARQTKTYTPCRLAGHECDYDCSVYSTRNMHIPVHVGVPQSMVQAVVTLKVTSVVGWTCGGINYEPPQKV